MRSDPLTDRVSPTMIRAPNTTEIAHLFALGEHELVKGRLTEALILFRFIRSIDPEHNDAAARLALTLFRREQWNEAWDAFDIRFKLMQAQPSVTVRTPDGGRRELPRWRLGEPPKHLLVMDEQGLGDTIHFVRFLRPLVAQGVEISFVTHEILFDLIRTMGLPLNLLPSNRPGSIGGATGWTPLLQIPRAMGIDPKTYADGVPYLSADPARVKSWARKMAGKGLKIGICWAGNADSPAEKGRSASLEDFAPLAAIPGVKLFSLQKGKGVEEISTVSFRRDLYDFGGSLDAGPQAFLDTAAVMMSLDLVVMVDTSVAHLAGALGRPVFTMLRVEPDWRWLARESDTVWYPTMRLFRQEKSGDWSGPKQKIVAEVRRLAGLHAEADGLHSALPESVTDKVDAGSVPVIPVSVGELADRVGILAIKCEKIIDEAKKSVAQQHFDTLNPILQNYIKNNELISKLHYELKELNAKLWDVEDMLRQHEAEQKFDEDFVALARSVYHLNDRRAAVKRRIDGSSGSEFGEVKSYSTPEPNGKTELVSSSRPNRRAKSSAG
jgi:Family of unknown function (DUF6165)